MAQFSFQRLDDGKSWGIKVSANIDQAHKYAHETVEVRKRDGSVQTVKLGAMITAWNANRAAVYAIVREPRKLQPFADHESDRADAARVSIDNRAEREALEDDANEAEYDEMAAEAFKWAAFYASPQGQLQKALDAQREMYRLADSFPVTDQQLTEVNLAVEAAKAAVAAEISR